MNYRLAYALGFHPWEDAANDPPFVAKISLLLVWPRRRRPLLRGANRDEVEAAFPGWKITDVEPSFFSLPKPLKLLLRPDEHWYRLRRE